MDDFHNHDHQTLGEAIDCIREHLSPDALLVSRESYAIALVALDYASRNLSDFWKWQSVIRLMAGHPIQPIDRLEADIAIVMVQFDTIYQEMEALSQ